MRAGRGSRGFFACCSVGGLPPTAGDGPRFRTAQHVDSKRAPRCVSVLPRILFDQPQVVEEAPLHSRMERVGGDFFAEIPIQATAYLLRWIIHDWDDDKAISILENVRKAARHGARLLLVESVIPETAEPLQLRRERIWREKMSTRAAREENESCP